MKRVLDILLAGIMLFVLWLPICVLLLITKFHFKESPVFKQARVGKGNKIFYIYKMKTMKTMVYKDGLALSDDARITRYGAFLRSTSLDELLQLWNVLKGDLSFVGPRPLLPEYLDSYTEQQRRRHDVMPGITGWAQVNGRNNISWEAKFLYDVWYVEHHSFFVDLKIMLLTFVRVIRRKDISQAGCTTTEKFNEVVMQGSKGE